MVKNKAPVEIIEHSVDDSMRVVGDVVIPSDIFSNDQIEVLNLLSRGLNYLEVCEAVDISFPTLSKWLTNEHFNQWYKILRKERVHSGILSSKFKLAESMVDAIECAVDMLKAERVSPRDKLTAAKMIIDTNLKFSQMEQDQKIQELEETLVSMNLKLQMIMDATK